MHATVLQLLTFLVALFFTKTVAECVGFSTNGQTAAKYNFYRFYDFQNLQNGDISPPFAGSDENLKTFSAAPWNSGWRARSWFRPASREGNYDMEYTPEEAYISNNPDHPSSTYLTLHTARLADGTQKAAELDYMEHNVMYASIRVSCRVRGAPGAVAGIFTYYDDTTESDIEILTRDPSTQVHFTNQPTEDPTTGAPIPGSTLNVSMNTLYSRESWNVYRLDWIPGRSAWYVNGVQAADMGIHIPDAASMVILNMWSNGGYFPGKMEIGGEASLDVQWIELMFNTTGTTGTQVPKGKRTVCSSEGSPGNPVPV